MTHKVNRKTKEMPVCIVCDRIAHVYEDDIYYCATHMLEKQQGVQRKCYKKQTKKINIFNHLKN